MSLESFDDILGVSDLQVEEVDVSEWWGDVAYVRALDAEAFGIFVGLSDGGTKSTFNASDVAAVVALTLCKPDGTLLVKRSEWQKGAKKLEGKSFAPQQELYVAALRLSGLTKDAQDAAEKK